MFTTEEESIRFRMILRDVLVFTHISHSGLLKTVLNLSIPALGPVWQVQSNKTNGQVRRSFRNKKQV